MKSGSYLYNYLATTDDTHTIPMVTLALLPLTVTVLPCPWQVHLDPEPPGPHEATDTRVPILAASPHTTSQGMRTQSSQNFPEYQHPFDQHVSLRGRYLWVPMLHPLQHSSLRRSPPSKAEASPGPSSWGAEGGGDYPPQTREQGWFHNKARGRGVQMRHRKKQASKFFNSSEFTACIHYNPQDPMSTNQSLPFTSTSSGGYAFH